MQRFLITAALVLGSLALQGQTVLRVGAGTAVPGLFDPIRARLLKERNLDLVYKEESGTEQFADIQAGKLDVCVSGITLEGWLESLNLPSLKEGDSHGLRRKISASTPA